MSVKNIGQEEVDQVIRKNKYTDYINTLMFKEEGYIDDVNDIDYNKIAFKNIDNIDGRNLLLYNKPNLDFCNCNFNNNENIMINSFIEYINFNNCTLQKLRFDNCKGYKIAINNTFINDLEVGSSIIDKIVVKNSVINRIHMNNSVLNSGLYITYNSKVDSIYLGRCLIDNTDIVSVNILRNKDNVPPEELYEENLEDAAIKKFEIHNSCVINNNIKDTKGLLPELKSSLNVGEVLRSDNNTMICGIYKKEK